MPVNNDPAGIATLRRRSAEEQTIPTVAQVKTIVDAVHANHTLDHTARLAGLTVERTLELISGLGEWLRQSSKQELPKLVPAAEYEAARPKTKRKLFGELTLFHLPRRTADEAEWTHPAPPGFLEQDVRDVAKPLAAVLTVHPDTPVIERWIARTYAAALPLLTYPVVAAVWRFATLGAADRLPEVSTSPTFAKVAVDAWDLLEVARADAMAAIGRLTGELTAAARDVTDTDTRLRVTAEVIAACDTASWVAEHDLARLARTAEQTASDARSAPVLAAQLRYLSQRAAAHPATFRIETVAKLREGQVVRISQRAGLPTDPPDPKLTAGIRTRLRQLGLDKDGDQLVPNALAAAQAGRLDRFWQVVEARADGDPAWVDRLLQLGR